MVVKRGLAVLVAGVLGASFAMGQEAATQPAKPVRATVDAVEPYTLAEGEVLKRVQAPWVEGRLGIYQATGGEQAEAIPQGANAMILRYEEGKLSYRGAIFGGSYSLDSLISQILQVSARDIEGDKGLLGRVIDGDFVVREGATVDQLREALAKIVADETGGKTVLTERMMEKPAMVLQGEWTGAVPNAQKSFLDVYGGVDLNDEKTTVEGEGNGTMEEFAKAVGLWIRKPVVVEATSGPPGVGWKFYNSRDAAARKKAHDAGLVLKHLEEQTGLKVSEEVRKVPRLVVEEGAGK